METKTIFMVFFIIITFTSYAYPSLGQEDVDDEPLVKSGPEFDKLDAISPASQDYNMHLLENIPQKYETYLETCVEKMEPIGKCGRDLLKEILTNEPVSRECCMKVVRPGKECYMEIQKYMFRLYQLKRFASKVHFRANQVWDRCSSEAESPSSSHHETIELS